MSPVYHMAILAWTELSVEGRNRRVITTMLLLGLLCLLVFAFAGGGTGLQMAVPAFWVSLTLATAAGVAQWAARTAESGVGLVVHLGPASGVRVFVGRFLAMGAVFLAVALLLGAITALLFDLPSPRRPLALLGALSLGTLGLTSIGGSILPFLRGRSARLAPLLFLPLGSPLVLLASQACLDAAQRAAASGWNIPLGLVVAALLCLGLVLSPRLGPWDD